MVSIDHTVVMTLKRIYENKEIETQIMRKDVKNLLLLGAENVPFTFEKNIYQQKDGFAHLDAKQARCFMVHLEGTLVPKFEKFVKPRKRYVLHTKIYMFRLEVLCSYYLGKR